jgi:hypothetical protein
MFEQMMEIILRGLTSRALYTWIAWSWLAAHSENDCTTYKKYSSDSKRPTWNSTWKSTNSFKRKYDTWGILCCHKE